MEEILLDILKQSMRIILIFLLLYVFMKGSGFIKPKKQ